jgi:hypothetical protein
MRSPIGSLKTAANSGPGLALCPSFSPTSPCFPAKVEAVRGLEPLHFFILAPKKWHPGREGDQPNSSHTR